MLPQPEPVATWEASVPPHTHNRRARPRSRSCPPDARPEHLRRFGVPVYGLLQRPGMFVVTCPEAAHASFDLGFNCIETVEVRLADCLGWVLLGEARERRRRAYPAEGSCERLLFELATSEAASTEVLAWVRSGLQRCVLRDIRRRIYWKTRGVFRGVRWIPEATQVMFGGGMAVTLPTSRPLWLRPQASSQARGISSTVGGLTRHPEPHCVVCKVALWFSAAGCDKCPKEPALRLSCLQHVRQLCGCSLRSRVLLLRFTAGELVQSCFRLDQRLLETFGAPADVPQQPPEKSPGEPDHWFPADAALRGLPPEHPWRRIHEQSQVLLASLDGPEVGAEVDETALLGSSVQDSGVGGVGQLLRFVTPDSREAGAPQLRSWSQDSEAWAQSTLRYLLPGFPGLLPLDLREEGTAATLVTKPGDLDPGLLREHLRQSLTHAWLPGPLELSASRLQHLLLAVVHAESLGKRMVAELASQLRRLRLPSVFLGTPRAADAAVGGGVEDSLSGEAWMVMWLVFVLRESWRLAEASSTPPAVIAASTPAEPPWITQQLLKDVVTVARRLRRSPGDEGPRLADVAGLLLQVPGPVARPRLPLVALMSLYRLLLALGHDSAMPALRSHHHQFVGFLTDATAPWDLRRQKLQEWPDLDSMAVPASSWSSSTAHQGHPAQKALASLALQSGVFWLLREIAQVFRVKTAAELLQLSHGANGNWGLGAGDEVFLGNVLQLEHLTLGFAMTPGVCPADGDQVADSGDDGVARPLSPPAIDMDTLCSFETQAPLLAVIDRFLEAPGIGRMHRQREEFCRWWALSKLLCLQLLRLREAPQASLGLFPRTAPAASPLCSTSSSPASACSPCSPSPAAAAVHTCGTLLGATRNGAPLAAEVLMTGVWPGLDMAQLHRWYTMGSRLGILGEGNPGVHPMHAESSGSNSKAGRPPHTKDLLLDLVMIYRRWRSLPDCYDSVALHTLVRNVHAGVAAAPAMTLTPCELFSMAEILWNVGVGLDFPLVVLLSRSGSEGILQAIPDCHPPAKDPAWGFARRMARTHEWMSRRVLPILAEGVSLTVARLLARLLPLDQSIETRPTTREGLEPLASEVVTIELQVLRTAAGALNFQRSDSRRLDLETKLLAQALEQRCWALRVVCCLDPVLNGPASHQQRQQYLHQLNTLEQLLRTWAPELARQPPARLSQASETDLAAASDRLVRTWHLLTAGQRIAQQHHALAAELQQWSQTGSAPSDPSASCNRRTPGVICETSRTRLAALQAAWRQGSSLRGWTFGGLLQLLERRLRRELEASAILLELLEDTGPASATEGDRLAWDDLDAVQHFLSDETGLIGHLATRPAPTDGPLLMAATPPMERLAAVLRRISPGGQGLSQVIQVALGVLKQLQSLVDEFQARCLHAFPRAGTDLCELGEESSAGKDGTSSNSHLPTATIGNGFSDIPETEACFWEEQVLAQFGFIRENLQVHESPVRTPVASDGSLWSIMSDWPNWDAHTTFSVLAQRLRISLEEAVVLEFRPLAQMIDLETVPMWGWLARASAMIQAAPQTASDHPPTLQELTQRFRRQALLLGTCRTSLEPAQMLQLWLAIFYRLHPLFWPPRDVERHLQGRRQHDSPAQPPLEMPSFDVVTRLVLVWHRTDVFPSEAWPECAEIAYLRLQLALASRLWELGSRLRAPRVTVPGTAEFRRVGATRKRRPDESDAEANWDTVHADAGADQQELVNPWSPERVAEALRLAPQVWAEAARDDFLPGSGQRLRLVPPSLDRMSAPVAHLLQGFDQELPPAAYPVPFRGVLRRYAVAFLEGMVLGHVGLAATAFTPASPSLVTASASAPLSSSAPGHGQSHLGPLVSPARPHQPQPPAPPAVPNSHVRPTKQRCLGEGSNFSLVLGALSELLRPRPVGSDIVGILQLTLIQLRFLTELAALLAGDPATAAATEPGQHSMSEAAEQLLLSWRKTGGSLNSRMVQQLHAVACINGVAVTSTGAGLQDVTFALGGQLMLGRNLAGVGLDLPRGGSEELEALPEPRAWDIDTPGFDWPLQFCYCYRQVDPPEEDGPPCRLVQCDGCFQWLHYDCVFRSGMDLERESFVCSRCCSARRGNALQPRTYQLSPLEVLPRPSRQLTAFGSNARVNRQPLSGRRLSPEAFPETVAEGAQGRCFGDPSVASAVSWVSGSLPPAVASASVGLVSIDQLLQCIPVGSLRDESLVCRALDGFELQLDVYERRLVQLVQTLVRDCWRLRAVSGSAMLGWEFLVRAIDRIESSAISWVADDEQDGDWGETSSSTASRAALQARVWSDGERDASLGSVAAFLGDVGGLLGQCMVAEDILAAGDDPLPAADVLATASATSIPVGTGAGGCCGAPDCGGSAPLFLSPNPWPLLLLARYALLVRIRLSNGPVTRNDLDLSLLASRPVPISRLGCLACAQAHPVIRPRLPGFVWSTLLGLKQVQRILMPSSPPACPASASKTAPSPDDLGEFLRTHFGTELSDTQP